MGLQWQKKQPPKPKTVKRAAPNKGFNEFREAYNKFIEQYLTDMAFLRQEISSLRNELEISRAKVVTTPSPQAQVVTPKSADQIQREALIRQNLEALGVASTHSLTQPTQPNQ